MTQQQAFWSGGAAVMATGAGSVIDARNGTQLNTTGFDVVAAYMSNGGVVKLDSSTGFTLVRLGAKYTW